MSEQTTFESGAVRDALPVRYDLCSPLAIKATSLHGLSPQSPMRLLHALSTDASTRELLSGLWNVVYDDKNLDDSDHVCAYILDAYARTMHEGSRKYGERNWEKGIPADNLRNHALNHLVQLFGGDTSEPHLDHLIWNVLTIIHFREKEKGESND